MCHFLLCFYRKWAFLKIHARHEMVIQVFRLMFPKRSSSWQCISLSTRPVCISTRFARVDDAALPDLATNITFSWKVRVRNYAIFCARDVGLLPLHAVRIQNCILDNNLAIFHRFPSLVLLHAELNFGNVYLI